jgi:uncharacterized protein YggE
MTDHESTGFGRAARTVSVSATGSVLAEPDVVRISAGVVTEAEVAKEALARNSAVMGTLIDGLKSAGIASKDLQTSALSVSPRYRCTEADDEGCETIVGYWASNRVEVTVRDVTQVGAILDLAASLGANQIGHISFGAADTESLRDEARLRAMRTARQRGELYAKAAGAQLCQALSISENSYEMNLYPYGMASYGGAAFAERRTQPPIEAGKREISVQIHVVYALR